MLEGLDSVEVVGYAINGEEGIHKIIALKPDLVTLDLEMPKMDGFTLLRILTTRFSLPVIVISALSGADKVFRALERRKAGRRWTDKMSPGAGRQDWRRRRASRPLPVPPAR